MSAIANYISQRAYLETLAESASDLKAVFLVGPADFGKTHLLRWFEAECGNQVRIVLLDFGDPSQTFTPRLVMTACAVQLGYKHFEEFKDEDARLNAKHEARIQDVKITGNYNILTATAGATPADQLSIAIGLIESFVTGLKKAVAAEGPVVLCFDGYRPETDLHRWLDLGLFIKSICFVDEVRIVIAGRDIPDSGVAKQSTKKKFVELSGVAEADEWITLAASLGRQLPGADAAEVKSMLKGVLHITRGAPGQIMRWLQGLPVV